MHEGEDARLAVHELAGRFLHLGEAGAVLPEKRGLLRDGNVMDWSDVAVCAPRLRAAALVRLGTSDAAHRERPRQHVAACKPLLWRVIDANPNPRGPHGSALRLGSFGEIEHLAERGITG